MAKKTGRSARREQSTRGISRIIVGGFKSIAEETSVEIRPLTLLAGPNSSGKSSLMQPLLLLKQTLEAQYDPGSLLIDGAHVKFTLASQFLSKVMHGESSSRAMTVEVEIGEESTKLTFAKAESSPIEIMKMARKNVLVFGPKAARRATWEVSVSDTDEKLKETFEAMQGGEQDFIPQAKRIEYSLQRDRCFLNIEVSYYMNPNSSGPTLTMPVRFSSHIGEEITRIIHLPGLRGNPERTYPLVPAGNVFPGLFQKYAASVIHAWIKDGETARVHELNEALDLLELQSNISTEEIEETQVGVSVSRRYGGAEGDRVSIADVGLAVSQVLPVLVALIAAEPGQLVYIEQPEIHLHPRAQWKLAHLLATAANRGVRLVIETHSSLLLRGILTEIAKDEISNDRVILHWFDRNRETGISTVHSNVPDRAGRVGDWPEDFGDVELGSDNEYLDAVENKLVAGKQ